MPFSRIRPPSELASGVSNAATTGLPFGSNRNVTCAIQAVAIEPPRLSASKRPDTASIAPASGSVALVFHRSRIIQAKRPLVIGTLNRAKVRELVALLSDLPFDIRLLSDIPGASLPEEKEGTYRGNALLKARAAARLSGWLALADDSGIEVDALGGLPGVRSARFGGPGLDDRARCGRLLDALRDVPTEKRTARFRCVIAVVEPGGREDVVASAVEGVILDAPRGTAGFGY